MKNLFMAFLVLSFSFSMTFPANILVWNSNPGGYDTLTDPEVGKSVKAAYWIQTTLTGLGYTFTYHDNTKLPADISGYDVIAATFGYFTC